MAAPVHLSLDRLEGVPFVSFYVGPEKVLFHVHQDLLFDASPVLKAAFSGKFQEASDRSMSLPDDDKGSVGRMIQWLYTRNFELTVPISEETSGECYLQLAKLNTLADKYDIYLLKNQIVDELFKLQKPPNNLSPPQMYVVAYVYNNTTEGSSFRKLMAAWYAYHIDLEWYNYDGTRNDLAEASQDFVIDVAISMRVRLKYPGRGSPFAKPASVYHESPPKKDDGDST